MTKCPFCNFENEEGALFCEQCKSDMGAAQPVGMIPEAMPIPIAVEAAHYAPEIAAMTADAIPMAGLVANEPLTVPVADIGSVATPVVATPELTAAPDATTEAVTPAGPEALTVTESAAVTMPASAMAAAVGVAPVSTDETALPPDAQPRLLVLRGQKRNVEYPLYEGVNFIGRADEKPVDIDLEDQEPPDRIWCSRQHALIAFEDNKLTIEDLNSANGTFVNRSRIYPGQKRPLNVNDVIQIGNVQLKVIV